MEESFKGAAGELIERLVALANGGVGTEGSWYDIAFWTAFALGGRLACVIPDTGRDASPGSVGEKMRETNEVVDRATYFDLIRERMAELVAQQMSEAFLVRAVRDQIRRELVHMADLGDASERRFAMRQRLEAAISDPDSIATFRALLAEEDPATAQLPDEEIEARLDVMAKSPMLDPVPLEQAVDRWAAVEEWDHLVARQLSDEVMDEWLAAFVTRMTR